jgi:hypothetical protein
MQHSPTRNSGALALELLNSHPSIKRLECTKRLLIQAAWITALPLKNGARDFQAQAIRLRSGVYPPDAGQGSQAPHPAFS